jgi:hypothetical protein
LCPSPSLLSALLLRESCPALHLALSCRVLDTCPWLPCCPLVTPCALWKRLHEGCVLIVLEDSYLSCRQGFGGTRPPRLLAGWCAGQEGQGCRQGRRFQVSLANVTAISHRTPYSNWCCDAESAAATARLPSKPCDMSSHSRAMGAGSAAHATAGFAIIINMRCLSRLAAIKAHRKATRSIWPHVSSSVRVLRCCYSTPGTPQSCVIRSAVHHACPTVSAPGQRGRPGALASFEAAIAQSAARSNLPGTLSQPGVSRCLR